MKINIKKMPRSEYLIYSAVIALGIILDQLTKWLSVKFLEPVGIFVLIKNFLRLNYVENKGAAFGMMADRQYIFMIVSTVMILGLSAYLFLGFAENRFYGISVAMIISGGIGNMIDRIFLGYVVDFIDFYFIDFAVFNGADSFVCVGAALLVLALIIDLVKDYKAKKDRHIEGDSE